MIYWWQRYFGIFKRFVFIIEISYHICWVRNLIKIDHKIAMKVLKKVIWMNLKLRDWSIIVIGSMKVNIVLCKWGWIMWIFDMLLWCLWIAKMKEWLLWLSFLDYWWWYQIGWIKIEVDWRSCLCTLHKLVIKFKINNVNLIRLIYKDEKVTSKLMR